MGQHMGQQAGFILFVFAASNGVAVQAFNDDISLRKPYSGIISINKKTTAIFTELDFLFF